ncbi:uncharacterized protein LOC107398399 [Tribolium castaneum]|uniref:Uncharacterized protein n=1 Tax=Tribolium castaneum TaxID=7070 RepID=D6WY96_TRICA|nr:PREDICTED: uncharacterized protein LOC107398399 [Tribolium castaneum]EFA07740.1 hypothetical protein TcasGA2_TC002220 [Tribolium castaneum]|eukprot:XP_015837764.1 PREDICTED: uncharacterized protein LOC107398399 [Tribolium castaneum]
MTSADFEKFREKVSKAKHDYCGTFDSNGFRTGSGCEKWLKENTHQKYTGQFLYNNLHNKGVYLNDEKGNQTYMDGLFFSNKLEGYGRVICADNTVFEGLFKQHVRFGPGVVTHLDGSQDVGIWDGFSLIKLCVCVGDDFVPRLGKSSLGKARLLHFRSSVPICPKPPDPAKQFLDLESDQLYNVHVKNPRSLVFNNVEYQKSFFTEQECTIDELVSEEEFNEDEMFEEIVTKPECDCFQPNLNRFGHMCVQLQEVESKLEIITSKKTRLEEKLSQCKYCCDHIVVPTKPKTKHHQIEEETEVVETEITKTATQKKESRKVLSFYSCSSTASENSEYHNITRSEIELKNYLYFTESTASIEEQVEQTAGCPLRDKSSGFTLPFSHWDSDSSDLQFNKPHLINFDVYSKYVEEEEEEVSPKPSPLYHCFCTEKLIENINILKRQLQTIVQEETFYHTVRNTIKNHLDIEFSRLNQNEERRRFVRKVVVRDVLAWNNEKLWITMLQHCFRHRFSEHNVRFNVCDLLTGQRQYFQNAGDYEAACKNFLEECSQGSEQNVFNYIRTKNINPDLCDARGNTGLMLATLGEKMNCVSMLVDCGAKVDAMNDEGLTPLTMSLLKYISSKFQVTDWEKAFLKVQTSPELFHTQQWRATESLLTQLCDSKTMIYSTDLSANEQKYIFNTDFIRVFATPKKKFDKKKGREEKCDERQLITIKKTILTLLRFGADPRIGDVPLKPIFLSVFTDDSDILQGLLKSNADPNSLFSDEHLTCLHLIVSLKPSLEKVKMCEILLSHSADPNIKTHPNHWSQLRKELLGEGNDYCDEGKNALHMLCLREDFFNDSEDLLIWIASILVANGCRTDDLYLGHTPLSLAVIRGNTKLIESLLKRVDPYQLLGNEMGNALTVLILNRFPSILPKDVKKDVAKCLIHNGLNPLTRIGEFENVIAFMENEQLLNVKSKKKTTKKKTKKKNKKQLSHSKKGKKKKKSKSSSRGHRKTKTESVEDFIISETRQTLYRHLQGKAIKFLYTLLCEAIVADPLTVVLAKFVKPHEVLGIIQLLFQHGAIDFSHFSYSLISDLVQFVRIQHHFNEKQSEEEFNKLKETIKNTPWKPLKRISRNIYLPPPETDDQEDKYIVCFQCLKSEGKHLIRCPSCELVYFCSEHCNRLNDKISKFHPCKVTFYDAVLEIIKDQVQPSRINVLLKMAEKMRKERIAMIHLLELEEKVKKLKFIPTRTRIRFEELYNKFQIAEKEREEFAHRNSLWDYASILMQNKSQSAVRDVYFEKIPDVAANRIYKSYSNVFTKVASELSNASSNVDSKFVDTFRSYQNILYNSPQGISPTSTAVMFTPKPRRFSQFMLSKNSSSTLRIAELQRKPEEKRKSTLVNGAVKDDLVSQGSKKEKHEERKDKNYYMDLLSKIFADFNLPLLLLPYACYKDGQVYYSMTGNMSYLGSSFHKLPIPD